MNSILERAHRPKHAALKHQAEVVSCLNERNWFQCFMLQRGCSLVAGLGEYSVFCSRLARQHIE